jgi:hypothetical protein
MYLNDILKCLHVGLLRICFNYSRFCYVSLQKISFEQGENIGWTKKDRFRKIQNKLQLIISVSAKLYTFFWIAGVISIYSKKAGPYLFQGYKTIE